MITVKKFFIIKIISFLFYVSFTVFASAATLDDVKTYFEEVKSKFLQKGDTLTYSVFEEKEDDRFLIQNVELYLAKGKLLYKFKQIEFTFESDATLINSALSNIVANGHTNTVSEGDDKTEYTIEQINVDGVIKFLDDAFIIPEPTTFVASKVSVENLKKDFSAAFDEFKLIGLQKASTQDFSFQEATITPITMKAKSTSGDIKTSIDGMTIKDFKFENGVLHTAKVVELGQIHSSGNSTIKGADTNTHIDFVFEGLSAKNLFFNSEPYTQKIDPEIKTPLMPFDSTSYLIKSMVVKFDGATVISTDEMVMDVSLLEDQEVFGQHFNIKDIFIDVFELHAVSAATQKGLTQQQLDQIKALGLEKLNISLELGGTWNIKTGQLDLPKYNIDIKQIGAINIAFKMSGLTEKLLSALQEVQPKLDIYPDTLDQSDLITQQKYAQIIQNLIIENVSIKLTDRDFLDKALLLSVPSPEKVEQTRQIAGPMVGVMMAPYNMPEFAKSLSEAVATFMSGNKSIEFAINPIKPLSILEIEQLEKNAKAKTIQPAEIVKRLNLSVKAE